MQLAFYGTVAVAVTGCVTEKLGTLYAADTAAAADARASIRDCKAKCKCREVTGNLLGCAAFTTSLPPQEPVNFVPHYLDNASPFALVLSRIGITTP